MTSAPARSPSARCSTQSGAKRCSSPRCDGSHSADCIIVISGVNAVESSHVERPAYLLKRVTPSRFSPTMDGEPNSSELTQLLRRWRDGDRDALDDLLPQVYERLRRMAHARMRAERPDHTLDTSALVHEAYLRVAGADQ